MLKKQPQDKRVFLKSTILNDRITEASFLEDDMVSCAPGVPVSSKYHHYYHSYGKDSEKVVFLR
jgi:hypothetical protein